MKKFIIWIENHPIGLSLILIGGIGGGVSTLTGATSYVWDWLFPSLPIHIDEPEELDPFGRPIVRGRLCPVLYEESCIDDNKATLAALHQHGGDVIAVHIEIDWAVTDYRWESCDEGRGISDTPIGLDHSEPDFVVFDVPVDGTSCDQKEFLGLPNSVLSRGLVQENAGNQNFLIIGTFFVGWGELFNDTLPTVAYPSWTKLEMFPRD